MRRSGRPEDQRIERRGRESGYVCFRGGLLSSPGPTASLRRTGIPGSSAQSRPHPPSRGPTHRPSPEGLTNYRSVISLFPPAPPRTAGRQVAQSKLHEFIWDRAGPG